MYDFDTVKTALETEDLTLALTKLESYGKANSNPDLERWANAERNGYFHGIMSDVPNYRDVRVSWWDENDCEIIVPDPGSEEFRKMIYFFPIFHGVKDIEENIEFFNCFPSAEVLKILNTVFSQIAGSHIRLKSVKYAPQFIRSMLKSIRSEALFKLQEALHIDKSGVIPIISISLDTSVPDLSWILDSELREILENRWKEANATLSANAPLATIILLGSIIEGLLLVKIKQNPRIANLASVAPKDRRTALVLSFSEWTLAQMIDVGFELNWITKPLKDFSHILRDYRNLVHPNHQQEEGYHPERFSCDTSFSIVKEAIAQISKVP